MNRKEILEWAERRMKTATAEPYECGYRYHHGMRVAAIAVRLARSVNLSRTQQALVYVAGVLHDVGKAGKRGNDSHGPRGANVIRRHLKPWMTREEMDRVCAMVGNHYERPRSSWYHGKTPPQLPKEVLVVQDADIIDHYGSMEVWAEILYARRDGKSPAEMLKSLHGQSKKERAEALKSLNFAVSRREVRRRFKAADAFFRTLGVDSGGR